MKHSLCAGAFFLFCTSLLAAAQPPYRAGEVKLEDANVAAGDLGNVEFQLGTLYVPENRAVPKSRVIGVGFARFKALAKTEAPPIFLLPGGPGSSYLSELKPGGGRRPGFIRDVQRFRAIADVVLVDQRGFSERGEVLKYRYTWPPEPMDEPASLARHEAAFVELARAAVADAAKKGIDLRGYTVKECADDVNDLRQALGYRQITLMGGSFGSQWSFAIMRRHTERVARALLGGVEPLDCGYDMPSHVAAALQRMWWEAEQDPKLKPYLPPGGLMAAARAVVARLEKEPLRVPVKGVTDAKTGAPVVVTLGPEDFRKAPVLRTLDGPAFILSLYHGHYDPWAVQISFARRGRTADFPLITALIDSSLGTTPRRKFLLQTDPASWLLGHWNFSAYMATADLWPSPDVGDDFRTEQVTPIPVVFVQGDWDPQTPIENVLAAAPFFPKGHVLMVERGGHGAMNQVMRELPEVNAAVLEYLQSGSMEKLPTRVQVKAGRFGVPSFPAPKDDAGK